MKAKIILLCVFCTLLLGCEKDAGLEVTFNITNNSSGIVKSVEIKLAQWPHTLHAVSLTNLDVNETETRVINLSSFNLKGESGYLVFATLSDDRKLEQSFGYFEGGRDRTTKPYNVEITDNGIILK